MIRNRPSRWVLAVTGLVLAGCVIWLTAQIVRTRTIEARLARLDPLIRREAQRTGLSRELIRSVIRAESGGDPRAVSSKQAVGLMQIRADAEADALRLLRLPAGDLSDPAYNLLIGTTYLKRLHERFGGDPYLALAAYHMGPSRVQEILGAHPGLTGPELVDAHANATTRAYVLRVLAGR